MHEVEEVPTSKTTRWIGAILAGVLWACVMSGALWGQGTPQLSKEYIHLGNRIVAVENAVPTGGTNQAQLIGITAPSTVTVTASFLATVTMKNTGTSYWYPCSCSTPFGLGAVGNATTWLGNNRIASPYHRWWRQETQ